MHANSRYECTMDVAIKVLKSGLSMESQLDFEQEIEILSGFDHPNIVKLLGIFRTEGKYLNRVSEDRGRETILFSDFNFAYFRSRQLVSWASLGRKGRM